MGNNKEQTSNEKENFGMHEPHMPSDESVNRIIDPEEFKSFHHIDKIPIRTSSLRTKDSQIQIVRRNLIEEPVIISFL